jgi:shikimate dehydrogenase
VSDGPRTRLAVLGSPISHSKSPAIQRAAYGVLGLDWTYESAEVTGESLGAFVAECGAEWRGLSLTMPLKRDILPLLAWRHELVDLVGGANTVLLTDDGLRGFNTDVPGAEWALREAGVTSLGFVRILGSGATAASLLAAVARLGARRVLVSARTPERAAPLVDLGKQLGVEVAVRPWGIEDRSLIVPDAIISTVPGGENDLLFPEAVRSASVLFDVAYDPWPSALSSQWDAAGGRVISGLDLLVHQAIGQVRVFVAGDPEQPLPHETEVLAAMRAAVA